MVPDGSRWFWKVPDTQGRRLPQTPCRLGRKIEHRAQDVPGTLHGCKGSFCSAPGFGLAHNTLAVLSLVQKSAEEGGILDLWAGPGAQMGRGNRPQVTSTQALPAHEPRLTAGQVPKGAWGGVSEQFEGMTSAVGGRGHQASRSAARGSPGQPKDTSSTSCSVTGLNSSCTAWAGHVCLHILHTAVQLVFASEVSQDSGAGAGAWSLCPPCLPPQAPELGHKDPCLPWARGGGPCCSEQGMRSSCPPSNLPQPVSFCLTAIGRHHLGSSRQTESCHFSDSAYKLNALVFAFKTTLYNIKMSGNTHANN